MKGQRKFKQSGISFGLLNHFCFTLRRMNLNKTHLGVARREQGVQVIMNAAEREHPPSGSILDPLTQQDRPLVIK